jgi:hypothetical protein
MRGALLNERRECFPGIVAIELDAQDASGFFGNHVAHVSFH